MSLPTLHFRPQNQNVKDLLDWNVDKLSCPFWTTSGPILRKPCNEPRDALNLQMDFLGFGQWSQAFISHSRVLPQDMLTSEGWMDWYCFPAKDMWRNRCVLDCFTTETMIQNLSLVLSREWKAWLKVSSINTRSPDHPVGSTSLATLCFLKCCRRHNGGELVRAYSSKEFAKASCANQY